MNKISDKRNKKRLKRKKRNKKHASEKLYAKKRLTALEKAIEEFPDKCTSCNKEFISSSENLDSWLVTTIDNTINLFCDSCKDRKSSWH
tara:strand:- start:248 stop:514 length:267 start_codon:yes stop_codon:yes gene_type:complete